MSKKKWGFPFIIICLVGLIILAVAFSVANGQADISFVDIVSVYANKIFHLSGVSDVNPATESIIWFVRSPRVFLALLVGMGLALVGVVMQAMVQNPLADPYILGISSGASLGATFAILIGFSSLPMLQNAGISFGAFWGALLASVLVFVFSSVGGKMTSIKLILSGTIISSLFGAVTSLIVFLSNNAEGMKSVAFWSMGSLASADWQKLQILLVVLTLMILFFLSQYRILDVMLLGEDAALSLGVNLRRYRMLYMGLTAVLTGVIVSFSGMIGFVGLIIPHIVRGFCGSSHKQLLPISILSGGLFMVLCDLLSRVIVTNAELPIGIITALIGAPIFIYMIVKKEYNFGGA
ncbi:iron ABC transporter permease [Vagococcus coleopterorum]|uniref:Iron ABC transporter permease n=1 Tax=Vagococcus coleopterorum TaxID=2714946 RepID=A0A6G8ANF1_9ENTE|nr:iron ABC transporter permease [Vagococcus coleopterorum]QIL46500.1 iron ABC transporter permease [Vagococcus coleopterorum]